VFNLSNFKGVVDIFKTREDFRLYTVKLINFLVGRGQNEHFRRRFIELFRHEISKSFYSFDMT
jgi:hypothetical protein